MMDLEAIKEVFGANVPTGLFRTKEEMGVMSREKNIDAQEK